MAFDPDSISQEQLQEFQRAAELAWGHDTRHPAFQDHPDPSAGQCYVTSRWLQKRLGQGHVATKKGHFFWLSPDKNYVIDLTGDLLSRAPYEDQPGVELEPHHRRWMLGPAVYVRATHPMYRDFRIVDDVPHERAERFAQRADAYMRGQTPKQADLLGPTAYPDSTPQKREEWQDNAPMIHDGVEPTSMSNPDQEYKFVIVNGQLYVSPTYGHEDLLEAAGVSPQSQGPIAVGYANVVDQNVTWHVTSNMSLSLVHKLLEQYSDNMGWQFEGMLDSKGNPIDDQFNAKQSFWYTLRPDEHLIISKHPLPKGRRLVVRGHTAHVQTELGPTRAALQDWARDFNYRIIETDMHFSNVYTAAVTNKQLLEFSKNLPQDNSSLIYSFPDQWTIKKLETYGDMEREGKLMGNCFSPGTTRQPHRFWALHPDYQQSDWDKIDLSRSIPQPLYSLRDPNNLPHVSIDPYIEDADHMALGKHNSELNYAYAKRISDMAKQVDHPDLSQFADLDEEYEPSGQIISSTHQRNKIYTRDFITVQSMISQIRIAEYPGGGQMQDSVKVLPFLDQHNVGDQDATPDEEIGAIDLATGLKCEACGKTFDSINALIDHDKADHHPDVTELDQNPFPWPQDSDLPLGFGTFPYPSQAYNGLEGM